MVNYAELIGSLIGTAFPAMTIYYLYSLERLGCQCSLTAKRTYILIFNFFHIAYGLHTIAMGGPNSVISMYMKYPWLWLLYLLFLIGLIVNAAFTIEFVNEMKRENCACSDSVFKDVMYILSIIQALTWSVLGLVLLVGGGILAKDFAAGKITMKNIEMIRGAVANGINKATKKS